VKKDKISSCEIYDIVKKRHQERFQTYDQTWHSKNKLNKKWTVETSFFFQKIQCCAICGIVKLTNKRKHYKTLFDKCKDVYNQHNTYTPYVIANMVMANYTTYDDKKFMHICINCHSNLNKLQSAPYEVYQPPSYMGTLFFTHLFHIQLLSFFNIRMHM
jgi:hypothetical protein